MAASFLWTTDRLPKGWLPLDLPVFLFAAYAALSISWAAYPAAAFRGVLNILCAGLVYFLVRWTGQRRAEERDADRVLAGIFAAAAVQGVLAVSQHFIGRGWGLWGSFANSNFLAAYLFFGLMACARFAFKEPRTGISAGKVFYAAAAALMAYGIVLTKSRAMAAVAVCAALFMATVERGRNRRLYLAGAAAGGAFMAAAAAVRFSSALDPYAFSRLNIWKAAWSTAMAHPFGVGPGGYRFYWLRFREPLEGAVFRFGKTADTAHSQFFGILSELGFPGILFAVAAACAVIVLAWRESRRRDRMMALSLIPFAAVVHAFFDVSLEAPGISIAVAACAAILANRNAPAFGGGVPVSTAVKAASTLALLPCLLYSAAAWLGYSHYAEGIESLKKGESDAALAGFSRAERIDPFVSAYPDAASSVHYRRFLQTRDPAHLASSVDAERQAAATSPEDPLHRSQLGYLLGELAEVVPDETVRRWFHSQAISALDESLRRDPHNAVAMLRKATVLLRSGRTAEARETLERLISVEPNAVPAYMALARLEEAGNPKKAAERYRKAIDVYRDISMRPLEPAQREFVRIDPEEVGLRIETLERGNSP